MIYTVTVNPSLDYIVTADKLKMGKTNRTSGERIAAGGKGLNVSQVLKNLGYDSVALGFAAGFTGEELVRLTKERGLRQEFLFLPEGMTRINVKLTGVDGTELNGSGPAVDEASAARLCERLRQLKSGDVCVLSGSVPGNLPEDFYGMLMRQMGMGAHPAGNVEDQETERIVVVDAAGELLLNALPYHPFLIKPNRQELEDLFQVEITRAEEVFPYAEKLRERGARNVLVSLGGDGAALLAEDGSRYRMKAPEGKSVNSVGAGDSMVAGFLAGWLEKRDYGYAFRKGVFCGSASAFAEGFATRKEVELLEAAFEDKA